MSTSTERELEVRRGSARLRSVWLAPTASGRAALEPDPSALPSAGRWVEKQPNTFAREQVTVPVTVGSTLRIF